MNCSICRQELNAVERFTSYHTGDVYVCHGCCESICNDERIYPYEEIVAWQVIVKSFFGLVFLGAAPNHDEIALGVVSAIIGIALIAWGFIPILREKSRVDSTVARSVARKAERDEARHRCKHCGGVSSGKFCEYCGAPFED